MPWTDHYPLVGGPGPRMMGSVGPMARCVDDLELGLAVLAPLEPAVGAPTAVAVFEDDDLQPVSAACRAAVRRAAAALGEAGHDVVEARPPHRPRSAAPSTSCSSTEAAAGLLPGRRGSRGRALAADALDRRRPARLSSPRSDPTSRRSRTLARLEAEADAWLERHGAALCPVAPDVAPPRGAAFGPWTARPSGRAASSRCARTPTRSGLPAVSVPVMASEAGLPVGVQLIGARGHERALLALARELERALGGWLDPDVS